MADSTLIIDRDNVTTLATGDAVTASVFNTTIDEIADAFDLSLETASGHDHDGTNSKSVSSGVGDLTIEEFAIAFIMGGYA